MNFLEERIVKDGIITEGNVLKVDSFLNHQMDIELFDQIGAEFKRRFEGKPINKILTIEASGIGIACVAAQHFRVPVVFAKKTQSINLEGEMYVAEVESFTHRCRNQVIVSQKFLGEEDHVLIIDDFLANGCALQGLIQIVQAAGATVEGIGIVIIEMVLLKLRRILSIFRKRSPQENEGEQCDEEQARESEDGEKQEEEEQEEEEEEEEKEEEEQ